MQNKQEANENTKHKECKGPLQHFKLLITPEMVEQICEWTNARVRQKEEEGTAHFCSAKGWKELVPGDVWCYFALILMEHVSKVPLKMLWSKTGARCAPFPPKKQKK